MEAQAVFRAERDDATGTWYVQGLTPETRQKFLSFYSANVAAGYYNSIHVKYEFEISSLKYLLKAAKEEAEKSRVTANKYFELYQSELRKPKLHKLD